MSQVASVTPHTYLGETAEINFFPNPKNNLSVTIDTDNLHMRSVTNEDLPKYVELVMKPDVIGTTRIEETATRIREWVDRWSKNNPFSGFAIFKKDADEFVGHIDLEYSDHPGEAELAVLGDQTFWSEGYASEAVTAIVRVYAPATVKERYLLDESSGFLGRIAITIRPDDAIVLQMAEKVGMQFTEGKYIIETNLHIVQEIKKAKRSCCILL